MKNNCILLLVFIICTSCAIKIKDFENYSSLGIGKAPLAPPPDQIKTKQIKVVLYNIEDKKVDNTKSAVSNISATLVRDLLKQTNVSILDRSAIEKFSDEAILAATETGAEPEFTAAQFAIKGQIDDYTSYSSYGAGYYKEVPGYSITNDDGSVTTVAPSRVYEPPTCTYRGEVNGRIEVYALPSLELVMDISLKGVGSRAVEVSDGGASQFIGLNDNSLLSIGVWSLASAAFDGKCSDQNIGAAVINQAVNNSVSEPQKKKLLNQFAAKGYVNDVRKHNKKEKYIVQVTIGNRNGLAQNGYLNVYRQQIRVNALSGKSETEDKKIAEARISQLVEADDAWLVVKDKNEAKKILIGDLVKVTY
jgi:hypothetical protein